MILDIDLGNTRLKWRIAGAGGAVGAAPATPQAVADLSVQYREVFRVRVASVATADNTRTILDAIKQAFRLEPESVCVQRRIGGFITSYDAPERLGVDRWLAALAAWRRLGKPCVVVDAGTALTVDLVRADGTHLGGYIVPGFALSVAALANGTGAVQVELEHPGADLAAGRNTPDAVNHGLMQLYLGLIERASAELSGDAVVVVAGGDANRLLRCLPGAVSAPDLVLDGIALACP